MLAFDSTVSGERKFFIDHIVFALAFVEISRMYDIMIKKAGNAHEKGEHYERNTDFIYDYENALLRHFLSKRKKNLGNAGF